MTARVFKPVSLCNPVDKNSEGIDNESLHLVCYELATGPGNNISVSNQLGTHIVQLERSRTLCVPSKKEQPGNGSEKP